MTTHVRVMYMLDKHVHALNFLTISIDRSNFDEHVRVWRLIQKISHNPQFSSIFLSLLHNL